MKLLPLTLLIAMHNPSESAINTSSEARKTRFAAAQHPPVAPPASTETRTVTIVKAKAPWYAYDFLLAREFKKVVPEYQRVDGLQFKAFSSIITPAGKFFGGIYLWNSEAQARAWYTPTWFANVERRRGQRPDVSYYPLLQETRFVAPGFNYRAQEATCVTVFAHAVGPTQGQAWRAGRPGLLRTYLVDEGSGQQGALLLFASAGAATEFVRSQGLMAYEWFKTPVLLNNVEAQ